MTNRPSFWSHPLAWWQWPARERHRLVAQSYRLFRMG